MARDNTATLLILAVLALGGLFTFMYVTKKAAITSGRSLPNDATNIVEVGTNWYEFTYKNQRFLFYQAGLGETQHSALVQIESHPVDPQPAEGIR